MLNTEQTTEQKRVNNSCRNTNNNTQPSFPGSSPTCRRGQWKRGWKQPNLLSYFFVHQHKKKVQKERA